MLIMAFLISVFAMVVGSFPRNMPKSDENPEGLSDTTVSTAVPSVASSRITLEIGDDSLSTRQQRIAGIHTDRVQLYAFTTTI